MTAAEELELSFIVAGSIVCTKRMDAVLKDEDESAILYRSHFVRLQAYTSLYVSVACEAGDGGAADGMSS